MIKTALPAGLAAEKLSRVITGTNEVSVGRSTVATGTGIGLGYLAASGVVVGVEAIGLTAIASTAAPVVIPVAIAAGGIALVRSIFE